MANWQRTIRLNPEWDQAKEGEISIQALAAIVAKKLRAIRPFGEDYEDLNETREELIDEFESLASDPTAGTSAFDYVMESLFNWGDTSLDGRFGGKKACWI